MRIEILGCGHRDIVNGVHVRYAGYYKMILKKFPYSVYYKIEDGVVKVWRILDNRRNPHWVDSQL